MQDSVLLRLLPASWTHVYPLRQSVRPCVRLEILFTQYLEWYRRIFAKLIKERSQVK